MTANPTELQSRLIEHLTFLYSDENLSELADQLITTMRLAKDCVAPARHQNHWSEADSVLITYGDSLVSPDEKPLVTLKRFIEAHLGDTISAVHVLPFFLIVQTMAFQSWTTWSLILRWESGRTFPPLQATIN